jgi:hypothetical protein
MRKVVDEAAPAGSIVHAVAGVTVGKFALVKEEVEASFQRGAASSVAVSVSAPTTTVVSDTASAAEPAPLVASAATVTDDPAIVNAARTSSTVTSTSTLATAVAAAATMATFTTTAILPAVQSVPMSVETATVPLPPSVTCASASAFGKPRLLQEVEGVPGFADTDGDGMSASALPKTSLSNDIEVRVRERMRAVAGPAYANSLVVRMVSSVPQSFAVPQVLLYFSVQ